MILIYVIIHCHPCSSDYGTCHAILFLNRPLADALTMNDHLAVTPGLFPMWGRGAYFSQYLVGVGKGAHSEGYGYMNYDIFNVNFYKHHCDVTHGVCFKPKLGSLIDELGACTMHSSQIVIQWLPRQIFLHWSSVHNALDRVAFINFRSAKSSLISSNLTMHTMAVLGISFLDSWVGFTITKSSTETQLLACVDFPNLDYQTWYLVWHCLLRCGYL